MRIQSEKIDEIRSAVDIVDLVGSFIPLKKRGKNFVGLCPFHNEKTPSFNVSTERQMYHCFGCGAGGNVFTFVMEYEKVSFTEAVRSLADRAGISIPEGTPGDEAKISEQEELYQVCRDAGLFFYGCLTESTEGKQALEYFRKRGFSDETVRTFGLGYSPNSWDGLLNHFKKKCISGDLLEKAGLVRRRDDGTYHDYFRGRAMFPVFSATGRVLGFGARKLREDDSLGKYINSPETLIYDKGRILYGLYQAKEEIRNRDFVILVEGYVDLITVYQSGLKNVVASSGTALTEEQIRLMGRYTKNITMVYDADSAGSKATLRGVDSILENDLDVSVASLPEGDDPDSFIRKRGGDAFRKLVGESLSFVDFMAQAYEREGKLETPEGQAQTVRAIVRTISRMKDELKRNFYIRRVSEKYRIYESTLHREMEKFLNIRYPKPADRAVPGIGSSGDGEADFRSDRFSGLPNVEHDILHAMIEGGAEVTRLVVLNTDVKDFTHPQSRALYNLLSLKVKEGEPIEPAGLVNDAGDPVLERLLSKMVFSRYKLSKGWEESGVYIDRADPVKIAADAIKIMKKRGLERMIEENQALIRESSGLGEDILLLLEKHQKLIVKMKEIDSQELKSDEKKG